MNFVYPAVLWGLLAVLIPLIIHLFNFRRYQVKYFSNTNFLSALKKQTHKKSELKRLLILFFRMLIIVCLVLVFAKPYIPKNKSNAIKSTGLVCIYIDNSFSMENKSSNGNLFNEAKKQAKAIVSSFDENAEFMLITNDMEIKHQQTFTRKNLQQEIDAINISPNTKSINEVYLYALREFKANAYSEGNIYIFSDFQRTCTDLEKIEQDTNFSTFLVPFSANQINNLSIDSAWILSPYLFASQNVDIYFRLSNHSENDIEKVGIKLVLNNKQKALTSMDIAANSSVEGKMTIKLDEKTLQEGYISITDNPITFDDKLFFSLSTQKHAQVLHIFTSNNNKHFQLLFDKDSTFIYSSQDIKKINYQELHKSQFVILELSNELTSGFVQEIEQYVNQGGVLLLLPPQNDSYNNLLNQSLGITSLKNLNVHSTKIDNLNLDNSLYKHVFESYPENIDLPNVFQYYEMEKSFGQNKEILISLENGNPFLITEQVGKGKIFMFASPLTDNFTDFHKHAIFVPTLYNMTFSSLNISKLYYIMNGNEIIEIPQYQTTNTDEIFEIVGQSNSFIPQIIRSSGNIFLQVHDNIKASGIFSIENKNKILNLIAFNYDRKESVMDFVDKNELLDKLKNRKLSSFEILDIQQKNIVSIQKSIQNNQINLYPIFIVLALIFLGVESFLLRKIFN